MTLCSSCPVKCFIRNVLRLFQWFCQYPGMIHLFGNISFSLEYETKMYYFIFRRPIISITYPTLFSHFLHKHYEYAGNCKCAALSLILASGQFCLLLIKLKDEHHYTSSETFFYTIYRVSFSHNNRIEKFAVKVYISPSVFSTVN
jgi:hypothetical protein